jgi:uncharacterized protein
MEGVMESAEREQPTERFVAFAGHRVIGRGLLAEVVAAAKRRHDVDDVVRVAVFNDRTGHRLDVDFSGSEAEVVARAVARFGPGTAPSPRGRGRPRLGVVSREVSLLPRHWAWLAQQRGGASAAIRRLVDAARKANVAQDRVRQAIEATHCFLWDMAGDLAGFEEATRALFAQDFATFAEWIAPWPADLRDQALALLAPARAAATAPQ